MKFWQMLTWSETEQYKDIAMIAEDLGFYGVMNADHALFPKELKAPYPYSEDGKPPMPADSEYPDPWVTIAQMAAVTTTLKFSTSVYILPLRNPIEVAKAGGTLALMTDNRFILSTGVGWMKEEFDIYGVDFKTRGRRYDECLDVLRLIWAGGWNQYHGEFIDYNPMQICPAPKQQVPVYLGGSSDKALRRTARLADGWVGNGNHPDEVPKILAKLNNWRAEYGRNDLPFETIIGLYTPPDVENYQRLGELGMTAGVSYPFSFSLGWKSRIEEKRKVMEKFAREVIRPLEGS